MHIGSQKEGYMAAAILKTILVLAIFVVTVFGMNLIAENGRVVQVSEVVTKAYLTPAATVAIAFITAVFDLAMIYLIVAVV